MKLAKILVLLLLLCKNVVGQSCSSDGELRLVGGLEPQEGRLEYCQAGVWGTVCNEGWDITDARVACQQLFPGANPNSTRTGIFYGGANSGQPIHFMNFTCNGGEAALSQCSSESAQGSTCQHDRDVGLICDVFLECTDGETRIAGGPSSDEGRVEVCVGGRWGTVCDESWGLPDVMVACRELGFLPDGLTLTAARNVLGTVPSEGAADRPIVLSGLSCGGSEDQLSECSRSPTIMQCDHSRDAGVRCGCLEDELRFVDGASENQGRVEFCQGGIWRILCPSGISTEAAIVACRQLGFDPIGDDFLPEILDPFNFEMGSLREGTSPSSLWFRNNLHCTGMESRLADCQTEPFPASDIFSICVPSGIGILCPTEATRNAAVCTNRDIRLQDGLVSSEFGRVEVCFNGQWGVVCDHRHGFDDRDATVACGQLGIEGGSSTILQIQPDKFGPSTNRLSVLDDLSCTGRESNLFDCQHPGETIHNCILGTEANIICGISTDRCPEDGVAITTVPENNQNFTLPNFGNCQPYQSPPQGFCNEVISDTAYVYVTSDLDQRRISSQLGIAAFSLSSPECRSLIAKVVCNFFFSPCGNQSGVHRPVSVCSEECNFVARTCSDDWLAVQGILGQDTRENLGSFSCNDTTTRFRNITGCCSNVGVVLPGNSTSSTSSSTATPVSESSSSSIERLIAPLAGGIIAAIVLIAIILVLVLVCLFVTTVRRKKLVRQIQRDVLTNPSTRIIDQRNSTSPIQMSPIKRGSSLSPSPVPSPNAFKIRSGSSTKRVVPNQYTSIFPAEKELDFSAPLLNPDSTKSSRISSSVIRDLSSDMVIPYCRLNLLDCIGQGEFGVVYKAEYMLSTEESGYEVTTVAVKTLKGFFDSDKVDSIMDESLKMKHFDHPNVLGLIGVCLDAGPAPYVVMPYMANGSLLHYLKKERCNIVLSSEVDEDVKLDIRKRLTVMCLQIANGMDYLTEEKFIHRDLAARNCMINLHFIIKISDFGLSEDVYSKNYFRQGEADNNVKLPVKWMAPESLNDGIFSEKTDVWSFGVTCWEVFSGGRTPYPGIDPLMLSQMLDKNQRLNKPHNTACSNEIYSLMEKCWLTNPQKRPHFSEIATILSGYLESLAGYLDMNFNPFVSEQDQKPVENGGCDILTRPDQLAALYENFPRKSKSPRSSPRASPRASPLPSPSTREGLSLAQPPNIKIQIDACSPPRF